MASGLVLERTITPAGRNECYHGKDDSVDQRNTYRGGLWLAHRLNNDPCAIPVQEAGILLLTT